MPLHERLKELRLSSSKTQEELAKQLGLKRSAYAAIENGRVKMDLDLIQKVTNLFSIPLSEFLREEEAQSNIVAVANGAKTVDRDALLASLIEQNKLLIQNFAGIVKSNNDLVTNTLVLTSALQSGSGAAEPIAAAVLERVKVLEQFLADQVEHPAAKTRIDWINALGKKQVEAAKMIDETEDIRID